MTPAEQKELFRQALALPQKTRRDLYKRLCESLDAPRKRKSAPVLAESTAVYGRNSASKRVKATTAKAEVLAKKEWNRAWKDELGKRIADIESGKVKCIPYAEARRRWDKILGRT